MAAPANIFTGLTNDLFVAADTIAREAVGAITSVSINTGSERAAVGQTVKSGFTRQAVAEDWIPSMVEADTTAQTIDMKDLTLTKQKSVPIQWRGEDVKWIDSGMGFQTAYGDQMIQAMRTLTNLIETDVCAAAALGASRAVGTSGTTPFATNYNLINSAGKILIDNGYQSALTDMRTSAVMDSTAATNLRNLAQLQQVNTSGGDQLLRQGILLPLSGIMVKTSSAIQSHTKGTAAGATTNAAGYAIGAVTITLASAGTGTIVAGDVITFAGDTNEYVVLTGDTDVSNGGTVVLQAPGLRQAIPASATAITVTNSYTGNVVFHQSAIELAVRAPYMPDGNNDRARWSQMVTDPHSGLSFDARLYDGQGTSTLRIIAVWGVKVWKPEMVVLLKG